MAVSIKLGSDVIWGTSSAGTLTVGKILSCKSKSTAKIFEQNDEDDELYSLVIHDQREEIEVEVLAKTSQTKPAIGTALTIAGITDAIVISSEENWQAGATKKFTISFLKSTA
jgi:hypothetical protein